MKWMTGGAVLLATMMAMVPAQTSAQDAPARPGRAEVAPGPRVEMLLRMKERLELSESQVSQLDKLREAAVKERTAHQAEMAELRSKVLAGEMTREDLRSTMESRRSGMQEARTQERDKVNAVLNDAQRQKLQEWGAQARAFRRGQMSARRGQGMWGRGMMGRRGFGRQGPAMGGRRFAPGAGMGRRGGPDGFMQRRGRGMGFGPGQGFGPGAGPDRTEGRGPGDGPGLRFRGPPPPPDTSGVAVPDSSGR